MLADVPRISFIGHHNYRTCRIKHNLGRQRKGRDGRWILGVELTDYEEVGKAGALCNPLIHYAADALPYHRGASPSGFVPEQSLRPFSGGVCVCCIDSRYPFNGARFEIRRDGSIRSNMQTDEPPAEAIGQQQCKF